MSIKKESIKENNNKVSVPKTIEIENLQELIEKDPDFLAKNPDFLTKNPDILSKFIHRSIEVTKIRKSHSGPIPDPETLKQYKQIYKNAPEIIFGMAKKEQGFRHISTYLGQISALLIGIFGLIVTGYLGVNDQPWLAGVIGFGSLASLVGVFLQQKKK